MKTRISPLVSRVPILLISLPIAIVSAVEAAPAARRVLAQGHWTRCVCQGNKVPLGMHRISPECLDFDRSSPSIAVTIRLREEPDDEEDEEEEDRKEEDGDDDEGDDGYSE
jgi:hypothetical protein